MVIPLTVTDLPVPAFLLANEPDARPPKVITSPASGDTAAVPVKDAVTDASYTLLPADKPLTVKSAFVIDAVDVGIEADERV